MSGEFKANLSGNYDDLKEKGIPLQFPLYLSPKLDGIRLSTVEGGVLTRSRKAVKNEFVRSLLAPYQGIDGEVILGDPTAPDVYHTTQSAVNSIKGEPPVRFYAFDEVSDLRLTFEERFARLKARSLPSYVTVLEQRLVTNQEEFEQAVADNLDQGYEGTMTRRPASMYKFGRSTSLSQDLLKCKPFLDSEAVILDVFEAMHNGNTAFTNELGRTARTSHQENLVGKGMAGGFIAQDCITGVQFRCAAGSFTHAERVNLWNNREHCIGKVIVYRYMPYGVKEETGIPRMPRAKGFREVWDLS